MENIKTIAEDIDKKINDSKKDHSTLLFSEKENKNLLKNNGKYKDCGTSFVIENKKTGKIVEIEAPSLFLAIKIIGWRPRHTILIDTIKKEKLHGE